MKKYTAVLFLMLIAASVFGQPVQTSTGKTAAEILGNPDFQAISYSGYRQNTRNISPTLREVTEDLKLLNAMGIKVLRTYDTQLFAHTTTLLAAIRQLKNEDPKFEMYVMLGVWMECEGAWTGTANHDAGNVVNNTAEIDRAIEMANMYPDIIKIIAVGNEAMVNWAAAYYVRPTVILTWVNYLQQAKKSGKIPADVWITSSDNFESWGGGTASYKTPELAQLIKAVDYVSVHTYPFHDTHYNPAFWGVLPEEEHLVNTAQADAAMLRAKNRAVAQYRAVADYVHELGIKKPIHIGETGWASVSDGFYGQDGSCAADEYKQKRFYQHMRQWTDSAGMSCFFFEAFDEPWKDANNAAGSENHFGLFTVDGRAKYVLWDLVDEGAFKGLGRNGNPVLKTHSGQEADVLKAMVPPPFKRNIALVETTNWNTNRNLGQAVTEHTYVVASNTLVPNSTNKMCYPSAKLKLNAWEGTCAIAMNHEYEVKVTTGTGNWWGCALELQTNGTGENLTQFADGYLHFELKGSTASAFAVGFQTGVFALGTQVNNFVTFGPNKTYAVSQDWKSYTIPVSEMNKGANMTDVTGVIYFMGIENFDGQPVYVKNIFYTKN